MESSQSVLVVDDHLKMATLIQRGLRKEGMTVDISANGHDAIRMATATGYDLIVLAVMLPGINGFEISRELRVRGIGTPILMLSARDATEDRVEALDSGADDYLTKPFAYAELLERLGVLLGRDPATPRA